jgi:hypothetical protein
VSIDEAINLFLTLSLIVFALIVGSTNDSKRDRRRDR